MSGVLEGIRVLDFGRYIAGPFCGTMLADLGAEVIRVEKLEGSEDRWVTPVVEGGEGAMFLQMGRNKLGLTLNPMKPEGREIVKKLVATADVVIANLPYEDLQKMGIDYETISAINPRIILATTSTFGSEGPYKTRVGFDTIGQAMSGAMYLSGDGETPTRMNAPFVDFGTALLNTVGVLAALMDRAKSGKGQKVETALLRTAINITNGHLIEQAMLDLNRIATLNRGFTAGPSDTFKCKDGWIYAMTIGQPLFVRWCKLMGDETLAADPRFKDDLARGDNGEALSAIMQKWCDTRTVAEALAALEANRIPAGPVYTPQQTLDDKHVQEAKFFHPMEYPGAKMAVPVLQEPVKLSRTPLTIRRRAPQLGEHTEQILQELGYDKAVIAKLKADRVV
ncbi:CoA transferase [Reyranella aquatilis]|uniref:CoA transferase n=1 Tax=Reyranella aquatilis TaxID=2035356 RepID=A0ABS8L0H2_9HYPH|nr:CoA transferase [Reyranella aquatilis]MCC8431840.1 CoA transferase [Reyranella aquatilis]